MPGIWKFASDLRTVPLSNCCCLWSMLLLLWLYLSLSSSSPPPPSLSLSSSSSSSFSSLLMVLWYQYHYCNYHYCLLLLVLLLLLLLFCITYCYVVIIYPISTLPEHLHSTLLSHAKTTWKHTKTKGNEFPSLIIARYPVSPSPTPTTHPLHWESQPHPPILVILYFGAQEAGRASRLLLLCYVCFVHKDSKLPVFI